MTQSKGQLASFKESTDKAVSPLKNLQAAMGNIAMVGGVVAGALFAAKKVMDFGREGAQLDYAAGKFDRLAASIGTTSEALLRDLKDATRGTISDMELMAGTGDLLGLGLAKSHDEAVRLSKVVGGLGMNMNQLVLTLTNQTTMRFDALGVSVDGFEEKVNQLKAAGMSASDAFKEAFLQQAEGQLAKIGSAADTDAGKFARLDATIKNLGDSFKRKLAPAMAEVAENLTDFLDGGERVRKIFADSEDAALKTAKSYEEYKQQMLDAAKAQGLWVDEHGQLRRGQLQVVDSTYLVGKGLFELTQIVHNSKEPWQEFAQAETDAADAADDLKARFDGLQTLLAGPVGNEYDDFIDRQRDLRDRMGEVQGKIDELNGKEWLTDAQEQELTDLKGELDELKTKYGENADAHEEANKRILYDLVMQRAALTLTGEELYNFQLTAMEQFGLIDGHTRVWMDSVDKVFDRIDDGKGTIDDVGAALAALPKSTDIFVNVKVTETYTERLQGQADAYAQQVIGGLGSSGNYRGGAQEGFATGVSNFVVPPGYPNDSFMVGLTSGEVVNVDPAGGGTVGRGGVIIEEVHIHNEMDYESLFYRFISDPRLERL